LEGVPALKEDGMDFLAIMKDLGLVAAGGFVTFVVTLAVNRVQGRKPSLVWRLLPPVFFPSQELASFSISIENEGPKNARDVTVVVSCPQHSHIDSLEVQLDEKAATHEVIDTKKGNEAMVKLPCLHAGLSCIVSLLATELDPQDIRVSVVAQDSVGKEKPSGAGGPRSRVMRVIESLSPVVALVGMLFVVAAYGVFFVILGLSQVDYLQELDIAQLYMETGHADLAIATYEQMERDMWFPSSARPYFDMLLPGGARHYYLLASAYADLGNVESCVHYLRKAASLDSGLIELAVTESVFDNVRSTPEFTAVVDEFSK
jgi:hypothetical protein